MLSHSLQLPSRLRIPTGLAVGDVNVYLIETADGMVLVDTGPRRPDALAALERGLAERGLAFGDLSAIWLTHPHVDHIGLVREVAGRSGARVFGSRESAEWLAAWEATWQARKKGTAAFCRLAGAPKGTDEAIARTFDHFCAIGEAADGVTPVDEGERLGAFDVVRVDGHARGHLAFVGQRAVLTGDFLLERISSNAIVEPPAGPDDPWPSMLTVQIASLSRALSWRGMTGYGGHGLTISDLPATAARHIAAAKTRQMAFLADLATPMTLWEATLRRFPDAVGEKAFLAMSETAGHLFRLRDRGFVRVEERAGKWVFEAARRAP